MSRHSIPQEMRDLPQWVGSDLSKRPINPMSGYAASVDDPSSWGTFEQACQCGKPYVGFVFTKDDPYVFIDLDTGKHPDMVDWHSKLVQDANSYTETSVSGKGTHIVVKGKLDRGYRVDQLGIEIYPHSRFMLMTGWTYYNDEINDAQDLLDELSHAIETSRPAEPVDLTNETSEISDEDLYTKMANADNGDKFVALFSGEWEDYPEYQQDHSRADLALATFLDFYTHDVEQCVRMFKRSKLYRSAKGRKGGDATDYILRTIKNARARNRADEPLPVDISELRRRTEAALAAIDPPSNPAPMEPIEPPPEDRPPQGTMPFPPGLVGEIAQYVYTSAVRPVPEVALMAALGLTAGIVGRQFNLPGTGLNMYLILLAPTGTGKEGAASGVNSLMSKVRETVPAVDQFMGPAEYSSGPALIKALGNQPCFFSIIGEFGMRMQTMADPRANASEKTLQRALMNLYSKSGWHQTENSSVYSDREKNTSTLYAPALTILGETTPETFFAGLNETHVQSGLIPRFMFMEYTGPRPPMNEINAFCDPEPWLVERLADLAATVIRMEANAACQSVAIDQDAAHAFREFNEYADQKINGGAEVYKQLWNRAHLKAMRLGGCVAVGISWAQPIITKDIAEWSIEFVRRDVAIIEERFRTNQVGQGEHLFESDIRKAVNDYIRMPTTTRIRTYRIPDQVALEPAIIPYGYLRRRLRGLSGFKNDRRGTARAITDALKDMVDAEILALIPSNVRKEKYGVKAELYTFGQSW